MRLDLLLRSVEGQRAEVLDAVVRDPDPDRAGTYVVVDRHAEGPGQVAGWVEFLGRRKAIFGHAELHHAVQRVEFDFRIVGLVGVDRQPHFCPACGWQTGGPKTTGSASDRCGNGARDGMRRSVIRRCTLPATF